ncbi:MAG: ABC transporter permease [Desulfurococcales archaeon]|nr:ABC transporter permease [Desulfurococcales archaeon]
MRLVLVKRIKPLPLGGILIPLLSIVIGILISTIILYVIVGASPIITLSCVVSSLISPEIVLTFLFLTILGVALLVAFSGSIWNIGAEGQLWLGTAAAAYVALFTTLPQAPIVAKIVMVLLAMVLGGAWAAVAGILRAYLNIDEVPVTLIMNYIAYYVINYLVRGPWLGKETWGYIRTDMIPDQVKFVLIPGSTTITYEVLILAVLTIALTYFMLKYTALGLRIRILGSNPDALKAAGVNVRALIIAALAISGAIAGAMGAAQLAGYLHRISYPIESHTANYGYTAILVAWLSMLDIRAIPIAAYIVSALYQAGISMQIAGVSGASATYVFIGTVLLTFTVLRVFSEYTIKIVRR